MGLLGDPCKGGLDYRLASVLGNDIVQRNLKRPKTLAESKFPKTDNGQISPKDSKIFK